MPLIMKIPMGIPHWEWQDYLTVFSGCWGKIAVRQVEEEICKTFGVKYCVFTELGRQAIYLALRGLGIGRGDGVIIPSYVCQSVILPVLACDAEPQFVDVGEDLNISPTSVQDRIDSKTRAILVPHMYGNMAKIEEIERIAKKYGLAVIDDAAQAIGAKRNGRYAGTFGDIGIFSFGPFKSLIATKGGALITNRDDIWQNIEPLLPLNETPQNGYLRFFKCILKFRLRKYTYAILVRHHSVGKNSCSLDSLNVDFSEVQPVKGSDVDASIIINQLKKMDTIVTRRRNKAIELMMALKQCGVLLTLPTSLGEDNVFTKFVVRIGNVREQKDIISELSMFLRQRGIEPHGAYRLLHSDPRFSKYVGHHALKNIYDLRNVLCLPIRGSMSKNAIEYMVRVIREYLKSVSPLKEII